MLASQANSSKLVYLHRMTGLKPSGNLTSSNYPHPHKNQDFFNKDGKQVLSGPVMLKKQHDNANLTKIHPGKPLININNRVECRVSVKRPKKIACTIQMKTKDQVSSHISFSEQECSMGEMAETLHHFQYAKRQVTIQV